MDDERLTFGSGHQDDPFIPAGQAEGPVERAGRKGRETKVPSYAAVAGKVQLYTVRKRISKGARILEVGSVIPDGFLTDTATETLLEMGALAVAPKRAVPFYVYHKAGRHDRP